MKLILLSLGFIGLLLGLVVHHLNKNRAGSFIKSRLPVPPGVTVREIQDVNEDNFEDALVLFAEIAKEFSIPPQYLRASDKLSFLSSIEHPFLSLSDGIMGVETLLRGVKGHKISAESTVGELIAELLRNKAISND